jgi:lipoyl(octanoyl) transferase
VVLYDNLQFPFPLEFQIYPYTKYDGLTNMAIDHYFASNFGELKNPIVRFYGWKPYCLSIGYHQSDNSINSKLLKKDGFELVKRPTGGRAIFHSEELTYSVIFPKEILNQKVIYNYLHQIFAVVLNKLNFEVRLAIDKPKLPKLVDHPTDYPCFTRSAETEVEYEGKKLIGSAQKIYPDSILQHGSILIGKYHENLLKYLITTNNERYLIEQEIKSKTICLNSINNREITPEQIAEGTIKEIELNDNISLIFKELDKNFISKAQSIYKNRT